MAQTKPTEKTAEVMAGLNDGFGKGLMKIAKQNPDVVCLTADLTASVRMSEFAEKYPERFFQVGIAEQNMAGIAVGLALTDKIPFMGSFASFQPYRNLDQIRSSICIMNANVKIISSHAGFSYAADGIQIQALEDIGIMRMLPHMTVLTPADAEQAEVMAEWAMQIAGPVYLRLGREKIRLLSARRAVFKAEKHGAFELGKAQLLREGKDLTIIANGYMVEKSLDAAEELSKLGISARVLNLHTIKPLDHEAIIAAARDTGHILTVEEHQMNGGVGSAVAEVLVQSGVPVKMEMLGVNDSFGQTAKTSQELWEAYHLTPRHIQQLAQQLVGK